MMDKKKLLINFKIIKVIINDKIDNLVIDLSNPILKNAFQKCDDIFLLILFDKKFISMLIFNKQKDNPKNGQNIIHD